MNTNVNSNVPAMISDQNPVLSTMVTETKKEKALFYNAVENPTRKVADLINQEITITNVYMEKAHYIDDEGIVTDGVKTVLIDENGEGILANSIGIVKAVYSIFSVFGMPDEWDEPMKVKVKQVETKRGRYFKLEVV